jgi:hypothetical protein
VKIGDIVVWVILILIVIYVLVETMDLIGIIVRAARKWLARKATPEGGKRG